LAGPRLKEALVVQLFGIVFVLTAILGPSSQFAQLEPLLG